MRHLVFFILLAVAASPFVASAQPKLVVVVSFDQYRGDYPKLFAPFAGKRGFARMRAEGAEFTKCLFNHATTKTGPGHATLLTGANAARTGIVSNDMCDVRSETCFYCAAPIGNVESASALEMPTIGDILKKKNTRSKVIGISQKDRAAILMAGRKANAVVWIDKNTGTFTTSSSYPTPSWLAAVSKTWSLKKSAGKTWEAEIPDSKNPAADNVPWESALSTGSKTFPHHMPPTTNTSWYYDVAATPFAVEAVFGAAIEIVGREKLGRDVNPDLLCVGISATDYLGHTFGPDSREVQEMYVHCDRWIERMIDTLDAMVGRKNYVLVVTSDHGIGAVPESVNANNKPRQPKIDAGRITDAQLIARADSALTKAFGKALQTSWVKHLYLPSLYLDRAHLDRKNVSMKSALDVVQQTLVAMAGIGIVARTDEMIKGKCPKGVDEPLCELLRQAYHPTRSGDVMVYPKPNWVLGEDVAEHGSPWEYDRWVPMLMIGGPIKKQLSKAAVSPADLAPTIAAWWKLTLPPIDGKPLRLKK